jgi:hypothetical protein
MFINGKSANYNFKILKIVKDAEYFVELFLKTIKNGTEYYIVILKNKTLNRQFEVMIEL